MNRRLVIIAVIALGIAIAAAASVEGPHYYRAYVMDTTPGATGAE